MHMNGIIFQNKDYQDFRWENNTRLKYSVIVWRIIVNFNKPNTEAMDYFRSKNKNHSAGQAKHLPTYRQDICEAIIQWSP